jgi:hypothetical protein
MRRTIIIGTLVLLATAPASAQADPALSIGDVTVAEAGGSATFTITASEAPAANLMVNVATSDGTANAPTDYTAVNTVATIAATTTSTTVSVPIVSDTTDESDETFKVTLSNPQQGGATPTLADGEATGTILDDDPEPSLSVDDIQVGEPSTGTRNATFTVKLSAPSAKTVTVKAATVDHTARAQADYLASSSTLTFAPGQTEKTFDVKVNGDDIDEPTETFGLSLSNPGNATIAKADGTAILYDGDPPPALSVGDVQIPEGNSGSFTAAIPVTLSKVSGRTITVRYSTSSRSATAGKDYVRTSGRLRIPAGDKLGFVPVTVIGDRLHEPNETFVVTLRSPVNASIKDGSGVETIVDDDTPPAKPHLRGFGLHPSTIKPKGRAVLTATLNQPATLRIRLERFAAGTKGRRGRWVGVRRFNVGVKAGRTHLNFAGGGLPPGTYRFVATPTNANGTGATAHAVFRVTR